MASRQSIIARRAKSRIFSEQPNLHLSPEERRYFGQLFSSADTDKLGVVTGEVAVKFFEKTRLSSDVLGEIWQIADTENRGLLTPAGFGVVLRLIGYAQAGRQVSADLALKREHTFLANSYVESTANTSTQLEDRSLSSMAFHHRKVYRQAQLLCKLKQAEDPYGYHH